MKTKTTLVIAALAVILGVAFATWTEEATIQVNAATGYIDADFTSVVVTSTSPYVSASATASGSDSGNDGAPSLTVSISNAYPGAQVEVYFEIYNDGTIPIEFTSCSASGDTGMLTVSGLPSTPFTLAIGDSESVTLTITAGAVDEEDTYDVTIQCTYEQDVP
ncbi:hypothetical protein Pogu_0790 [Pyrobaculum oguniense TE7]|uniref:CARDB domain-containing protein n=1 Tax=Pyrobaculum oguniense (strain DSM 13380 / JCM 10595 / TE7) TaxID=698757 RepID=H6Q887_PYROT|nr:hypothetical protein Pogu_0790 [Pyrobaculum oguniense TE7]